MTDLPDAAITAMCECGHHWSVHAESNLTASTAVCHGYTGSATPGPLREPCRCTAFAPWSGPRDSRTGEPVKPLTVTVDARVKPAPEPLPDAAITAPLAERAKGLADDDALDCGSSDLELFRWALKARALLREVEAAAPALFAQVVGDAAWAIIAPFVDAFGRFGRDLTVWAQKVGKALQPLAERLTE